jgi:LCP family protein required for cell wall assembly
MDHGVSGRLWLRFLLGAALVLSATAVATAVLLFNEVDGVVAALRQAPEDPSIDQELAEADAGTPQTVMLVGSDQRAATAEDARSGAISGARSDTIILVRLDPNRDAIALMSLPRDLKVSIPGIGTDKLNAAFEKGGIPLTLQTVKRLTGLQINQVVNVDFRGFREAVDAVGCVYADVDRRYFNDNTGPVAYATIDVPAGYQRLCGRDALDYVRHRYSDNDIFRSARQQEFLRQAKQQLEVGELLSDRGKLIEIFGRNTRSSVRTRADVLRLLKLLLSSMGRPIQEVHFEGRVGASYVTASSATVRKLTQEFLGVIDTPGPRGTSRPRDGSSQSRRRARRGQLADVTADGMTQAQQVDGGRLPVFYPTRLPLGAAFADAPRSYRIRASDGRSYGAYRMVVNRGRTGEYLGLQGTTWRDPPVLEDPSETRRIGGRTYELHYDGDRLRLVAWRNSRGAYWVSNTLLQNLSESQMLDVASSAREL